MDVNNEEGNSKHKNPREYANVFSLLSFAWLYQIFRIGFQRNLETKDLYCCLKEDSSKLLGNNMSKAWHKEENKINAKATKRPSLIRVLVQSYGIRYVILSLCQAFHVLFLRIIRVVLLAKVLNCLRNQNEVPKMEIFGWASGFIICQILDCILQQHVNQGLQHLGMKLRICCTALVYRKCLKISKASLENNNTSVGQITNFLGNDVTSFNNSLLFLHYLWMGPIQTVIITLILYQQMNVSSFAGTSIIFLLIPFQVYCGKWVKNLIQKVSLRTDMRLSLMNEIVAGVQVIKMYAWEKPFSQLVDKARAKEMSVIRKIRFISSLTDSFRSYAPQLCIFCLVLFYVLSGNNISAENFYMVTAFYNELRGTIFSFFSEGIQGLGKLLVAINRLENVLMREETQDSRSQNINEQNPNAESVIRIARASAKWSPSDKKDTLHSINLAVQRGSLSAIVGQTGSGKSSFLHVILKELPLTKGTIDVTGKIGYISQQPWVFASSVRQNILFGLPMHEKRYAEVIKVCQLNEDFALFPFGDKTLIGEKGITLSGGQKARINLARAVYLDADVYLLDDPLSAVDTQVGRKIFEDCICGYLKGKTRILVTHQLQYLKTVDRILVLNNGLVEIEGTFNEINLHSSELDFIKTQTVTGYNVDDGKRESEYIVKGDHLPCVRRNSKDADPEEVPEHRTVGNISNRIYLSYFKAAESLSILLSVMVLGITYQVVTTWGDFFLAGWVNRVDEMTNRTLVGDIDNMWYIRTYSSFTLLTIFLGHTFFLLLREISTRSSQNLHSRMFYSIMRTTMSFFHENTSGRILNRFSKDTGIADKELPLVMENVAENVLMLVAALVINCSVNRWLAIPTIVIGSVFYILYFIYVRTFHSLTRLEAINQSPVFNHVSATLQGITTIRAFKAEQMLTKEFDNYQDLHSSACYLLFSGSRAFGYYINLFCSLYVSLIMCLFVSVNLKVSAGYAGLAISQCILLSSRLQWCIRKFTEMQNYMTSVERMIEYTDLDEECPLETRPENRPRSDWPSEGCVEFKDVCLCYSPTGAMVLKNLNFVISSREKVGIVGRTGAGKSSLIAALFRLAYLKGEIYIDGLATSNLGLHDVRSSINIVPQDPLLFAGTIRLNLDPFDNCSDDELWQALAEVELKNFIMGFDAQLQAKVSDGGLNFSVGQRQLLCLARAIVRNKKILVLDEATANVDLKTDELIQKTIRKKFKDCTVFIIAHRLNTVMDCDKFIVMDSGFMVEFGHPYDLLKNKGHLYNMVQQTGTEMANVLTRMSQNGCD